MSCSATFRLVIVFLDSFWTTIEHYGTKKEKQFSLLHDEAITFPFPARTKRVPLWMKSPAKAEIHEAGQNKIVHIKNTTTATLQNKVPSVVY